MKNWVYLLLIAFATFSCSKEDSAIVGWVKVNSVVIGTKDVGSLAISGANMYAVCIDYEINLFKSVDEGINWTKVKGIPQTVRSISISDPYIFAGTSKGIYRSSDNGATWLTVNAGLKYLTDVHTFVCNNQVYAYADGDVYKTINNGES